MKDFIKFYNPENRHKRKETERFRGFTYDELLKRDKVNLDIFWLRDESLEDSDKLSLPNVIAQQIVENLESALEEFSQIEDELILSK